MKYLFLFILIVFSYPLNSKEYDYGLYIKSYPLNSLSWTSLELEDGKPVKFNKKMDLSFDLFVRDDCVFGHLFRIYNNSNENIELFFTVQNNDRRLPALRINDSIYTLPEVIERNKWFPVYLSIDYSQEKIYFSFNNQQIIIDNYHVKSKDLRFYFGKSEFNGIKTKDIASVNIRNIKLKNNDELIRYWKLEKHNDSICYDELNNVPAVTVNPQWMIDEYATLKLIYKHKFNPSPSIAFKEYSGEFYLINDSETMINFDSKNERMDSIHVKGGNFVTKSPNQLIYINPLDKLISYRIDENIFSFFDFDKRQWTNNMKIFEYSYEHSYWNTTTSFNPNDSTLISFGGYGYYVFNNELTKLHPFRSNSKERIRNITQIEPRCSSSSVIVNDTLYIFGGRGSESGHQELSPQNYYDLFAIDLSTGNTQKLWEHYNVDQTSFLPSENMIYDEENKCFYAFFTQNGGKLIKITTQNNKIETVSLNLNLDFTQQYLYSNLYYSKTLKKFFVVINQIKNDNSAEVSIYSINSPLVSLDKIYQTKINDTMKSSNILRLISLLLLPLFIYLIYFIIKKRKNNNLSLVTEKENSISVDFIKDNESIKKRLYLLGPFQIIDKEGIDITSDFTPTLENLLILLVLYTQKNKRGITGNKINLFLWPDKKEKLANNSRNVNISKLRSLLEKVGDVKIINNNKCFSISFAEDITLDYIEILDNFRVIKNNFNIDTLNNILYNLTRGKLLQNKNDEWFDKFKNDFSNETIDILYQFLDRKDLDNKTVRKICNIILQNDHLNERAILRKCLIFYSEGKKGVAKKTFDDFCSDYKKSLGIDYNYSFANFLKVEDENTL